MKARRWRPIGTAALAVAVACGWASSADAAIYWFHMTRHKGDIARASLDGKHVDQRFVKLRRGVLPTGLAVDRQHIYWTAGSLPPVGIGRANLDGSGINQAFMPVMRIGGAVTATHGIAVDGGHIYWVNTGDGTIGRSELDGSGVNQAFITGPPYSGPSAIAIGGGYVFWTLQEGNTIGRAKLDGSEVNARFIVGAHVPDAIAVAGGYVYWGNLSRHGKPTVGRAKIDGTHVNERLIRHTVALSLAVKGQYVYGSDFDHIWRARVDGSHLKRRFIKAHASSDGLVVR
jgi:hypothetical protein